MLNALFQLALFAAKALIIVAMIIIVLVVFFILLAKSKEKIKGRLNIKNLNLQYDETKEMILAETLTKKAFKQYAKEKKAAEKKLKTEDTVKKVYVLNFDGDMKASAVSSLSEEITAVLGVATPQDEVVLRLESGGGVVHGYGLAAAQLMRLRARHIPLVVAIDKIAASGGYMMACIADKIISAPFAIVGSIGVVIQLPNFNRLLKDKHIDFELHTAGQFKRTITMFGENTDEGRQKLQHEIEDIHGLFKNLISTHRQQVDINEVATGEHWLGEQALSLKLVDALQTSDDYLYECSKTAKLYEISYEEKKPLLARLSSAASLMREKLFGF